jgi:opine dehydrogenase
MANRRVAVLGAGNGGRAAAGEFALRGHDVTLFEVPDFAAGLAGIRTAGTITLVGQISGTAPVRVELDLAHAIEGVEAIVVVVPTNHHRVFAAMLAPLLADGMNVVLMPGSLGSLDFVQCLRDKAVTADVTVSEIAALPYAARITGPADVTVHGRRRVVSMGVFPADRADQVVPIVDDLYPGIDMMPSVLAAGLSNPNPTLHCLGVLLSASRIEYSHGEFYYYEEGMTPHVCEAIEAIDAERLAIAGRFGIELLSLKDTYPVMGYGPTGDTFWSVIRGVRALNGIKGPSQIDSRYLTEDVPIGLTIYAQLGRQVGLEPVLMESVIHLTRALLGTDFGDVPRTLARCGLDGLDRDGILFYVTTGSGQGDRRRGRMTHPAAGSGLRSWPGCTTSASGWQAPFPTGR